MVSESVCWAGLHSKLVGQDRAGLATRPVIHDGPDRSSSIVFWARLCYPGPMGALRPISALYRAFLSFPFMVSQTVGVLNWNICKDPGMNT